MQRKIFKLLKKIKKELFPNEKERLMKEWKKKSTKLRYDYNLNEKSLILDVGGYEGQWTSDIYSMYCSKIIIFEPVKMYADEIKKRFKKNNKIKVYNYALGGKTEKINIGINEDASSVFKKNLENTELVNKIDIKEFIDENDILFIDLIKINIEGGEYELLDRLIKTEYIKKIKDIQIQFHDCFLDAEKEMNYLKSELSKTHYPTYQYKFIWENWRLK